MVLTAYTPKRITRGSSVYYALLYCTKEQRLAIEHLYEFYQLMQNNALQASESFIAKAKLNWWLEEITFLYQKKARHPLSQALWPIIQQYQLPSEWFLQIIHSNIQEVELSQFNTQQELLDYCCDNRGAFHLLLATILGPHNENTEQFAILSGVAYKLVEIIRYFGQDYRRGRLYISRELFASFHLDPSESTRHQHHEALEQLLEQQALYAKDIYQKALHYLSTTERFLYHPLIILNNLHFSLLDEMHREHFQVLNQKYSLTPLRKWWIAWRNYHQAKIHQ